MNKYKKVYVVMLNDFPEIVCTSKKRAELEMKRLEEKLERERPFGVGVIRFLHIHEAQLRY